MNKKGNAVYDLIRIIGTTMFWFYSTLAATIVIICALSMIIGWIL